MSDQFKGLVVTLKKPTSDKGTKAIQNAILQMKGVISVEPVVDDAQDSMNRQMVRNKLIDEMWKLLKQR